MKVLIASDFYADFEMYDTPDIKDLIECVKRLMSGANVDMSKHRLICSSDDTDTQEAINAVDKIIFTSEL